MGSWWKNTFRKLHENEDDVYHEAFNVLLKVLDNIIKAPDNKKYRRLRLASDTVSKKLIPAVGAMECLFELGFREADEYLEMPNIAVEEVKFARREFYEVHEEYLAKRRHISTEAVPKFIPLFEEIRSISKQVLLYENEELQAIAKSTIPLERLKSRCSEMTNGDDEFAKEFALIFELMRWFKHEFFKWMNAPRCEKCECNTMFTGLSQRPEDLAKASRVEEYMCLQCSDRLIFPRYNDPAILLTTRVGRCGEWANCFCLFCRSLGYETRFILDKTDHVWVEIFSNTLSRWIHCDPCENTLDKPLMYEKGWQKKLSYVIAISCEEIQDVTWRYTTDFHLVRTRRTLCREDDLTSFILQHSKELQTSLAPERKTYLTKRRLQECIGMLLPPKSDGEYDGRTSGSLEWRLHRKECRKKSFVWKPNKLEIINKIFTLRYYSPSDKYLRTETLDVTEGWENGVFEFESIFRKEELDWKMSYLCRTESSHVGTIKWKFSSEKANLPIDQVIVSYPSTVYRSGQIRWLLCNDETCLPLKSNENRIETDAFRGSYELSLTATLSGGDGKDAWQHAQLFRQSLDSKDFSLEVIIKYL